MGKPIPTMRKTLVPNYKEGEGKQPTSHYKDKRPCPLNEIDNNYQKESSSKNNHTRNAGLVKRKQTPAAVNINVLTKNLYNIDCSNQSKTEVSNLQEYVYFNNLENNVNTPSSSTHVQREIMNRLKPKHSCCIVQ